MPIPTYIAMLMRPSAIEMLVIWKLSCEQLQVEIPKHTIFQQLMRWLFCYLEKTVK